MDKQLARRLRDQLAGAKDVAFWACDDESKVAALLDWCDAQNDVLMSLIALLARDERYLVDAAPSEPQVGDVIWMADEDKSPVPITLVGDNVRPGIWEVHDSGGRMWIVERAAWKDSGSQRAWREYVE